jgi:diazepam-binding inhibitor (GABA receptor modulator, acyl-CoA-binding protein)
MFDLKGKAKQKAWQKEVDAGTSQSDAEKRYVALVEKLKTSYGYDASKAPEAVGGA